MTYRVELTGRADRDLDILYVYVEKNATDSPAATRWYNGIEEAVYSLESFQHRCPVAREGQKSGRLLRHLMNGQKPHVYRVIYEIDEHRKLVTVFTIWHVARKPAAFEE